MGFSVILCLDPGITTHKVIVTALILIQVFLGLLGLTEQSPPKWCVVEFSHKLIDNEQHLVKSNACTVLLSKFSF